MSFHAGRTAALIVIADTCCTHAAGVRLTDRQFRRVNKRLSRRHGWQHLFDLPTTSPCQRH